MARQYISEVRQAAFINVRARKLVLNFNPIADRLSSNAFMGIAERLRELQLSGCGLRTIPVGILTGMTELRHLHMWKNNIERMPAYVFDGAVNLRELMMWGNWIEELGEHSLFGLHHLKRLDLERNR